MWTRPVHVCWNFDISTSLLRNLQVSWQGFWPQRFWYLDENLRNQNLTDHWSYWQGCQWGLQPITPNMAEYVWWTLDVTGESACSWYNSLMETNKFAMSVKIKTTSELKLNDNPDWNTTSLHILYKTKHVPPGGSLLDSSSWSSSATGLLLSSMALNSVQNMSYCCWSSAWPPCPFIRNAMSPMIFSPRGRNKRLWLHIILFI